MRIVIRRIIPALAMLAWVACPAAEDCVDYGQYLHCVGNYQASVGALDVAVRGDHAFLTHSGLNVVDISDPEHPVDAAMLPIAGSPYLMELDGDLAYMTLYTGGLAIVDIGNPTAPVLLSSTAITGQAVDVAVDHGVALVTRYRAATVVLDVSDPRAPVILSEIPSIRTTMGVGFAGSLAAICDQDGKVSFWDVQQPASPLPLGVVTVNNREAFDVLVDGGIAYVTAGTAGLVTIDATQPESPVVTARFDTPSFAISVEKDDGILFVTDGSAGSSSYICGLFTFELSDPRNPEMIGHRAVMEDALQVGVDSGRACVTSRYGPGMLVFEAGNPRTEPRQTGPTFSAWSYMRVAVLGGHAWVARPGNGAKYIVNTVDPTHPFIEYAFPSQFGYQTIWVDIALQGDLACIAEGDLGSSATDSYVAIYRYAGSGAPVRISRTSVGPGIKSLAVAGNRLIAVTDHRLHVLDITDPAAPVVRGSLALSDWSGESALLGNIALVSSGQEMLVIDVSNPANPVERSRLSLGAGASQIVPRGDTAIVCLDFTGIRFVDVSVPNTPRVIGSFDPVLRTTNAACVGNVLYTGCFAGGGALYDLSIVAYDITDLSAPRMLGSIGDYGPTGMAIENGQIFYCQETGSRSEFVVAPVQCDEPQSIAVTIDIRPGSDNNRIDCRGGDNGVIPVAILTTATFDASTVDHTTVRFGPGGAAEAHANHRGPVRHLEDVDGDGDRDLVFHFRQGEAGIRCGDIEAVLTGMTFDGVPLVGTDRITTRGGDHGTEADGPAIAVTPNPFNPQTRVTFRIATTVHVHVAVHDIRGRLVASLVDGVFEAGEHAVTWPGRDAAGRPVPSGVYFFRVVSGEGSRSMRAMLLK